MRRGRAASAATMRFATGAIASRITRAALPRVVITVQPGGEGVALCGQGVVGDPVGHPPQAEPAAAGRPSGAVAMSRIALAP